MFKMATSGEYSWPVKVEMPVDGGKTEKSTFDARFKRLPQADVERIGAELQSGAMSEDRLVDQILVGWKGVLDEDGQELPYSEDARDRLLAIYPVRACIITAWTESLKAGRAKN